VLLPLVDRFLATVGPRYRVFIRIVSSAPPPLLARVGRWRAVRAAAAAYATVPAYRDFLDEHVATVRMLATLDVPPMDKERYVRRYTLDDRVVGGRLPTRGVAIDESSGSTGTPYNWVRTEQERRTSHVFISHFARYCFGTDPLVAINAFSMGAWATGINMGVALERNAIVKSTGPDLEKILGTLELLGKERRYLLCGYPPFLKHLIDVADERGFPLPDYRLMALVGGEGMSEGLRDYLLPVFTPVYSGFGATDLEIGMAGETPLSVAIRRAARHDTALREGLFGGDSRLPMLFQYNPLNHLISVTADGELLFTIARPGVLSPRIAYNLHDEGGVATFGDVEARFAAAGRRFDELVAKTRRIPIRLPFLWVYGRKDSTVSVMGANIYPEDLEQALYDEPELAARTSSFCLGLDESADATVRPAFSFEVRGEFTRGLEEEFAARVVERIRAMNSDFRVALAEHPALRPVVRLHAPGTGPFAADAMRIKQTRVVKLG
jgi:phenylacetate-CoA ligase